MRHGCVLWLRFWCTPQRNKNVSQSVIFWGMQPDISGDRPLRNIVSREECILPFVRLSVKPKRHEFRHPPRAAKRGAPKGGYEVAFPVPFGGLLCGSCWLVDLWQKRPAARALL